MTFVRLKRVPSGILTVFQNFSTMTHALSLPPGYQRLFEYNYAVEAAGGYTEVDPSVAMNASDAKAVIKRMNSQQPHVS